MSALYARQECVRQVGEIMT